jgi:hypothetical protein
MTTATMTLKEEIRAYMHADGDGVAWTTCEDCGESVHEAWATDHDGYCPRCHHVAALAEAKDAVVDARDELSGLAEEMRELRSRIEEAKASLRDARDRLAELRGR